MEKILTIVPTYNERENIANLIGAIQSEIKDAEILVVDDNSLDGTADAVRGMINTSSGLHLIVQKKREGLGAAYLTGFQYAMEHGMEYVVTMDADFSHDPKYLAPLLDLARHHDVVIASRYVKNSAMKAWPFHRWLLSVAGNWYIRFMTGLPVKDCTSGFKCYRVDALRSIDFSSIKARHFIFQTEIIYRLFKKHQNLAELPYVFMERAKGQSKISLEVLCEALWIPIRLRFS